MDDFHLPPLSLLNYPASKVEYDYIETTQYLLNGILAEYLVSSLIITAVK